MRMPKGWSQHTHDGWWCVFDEKGRLVVHVAIGGKPPR
jgi:hypothetical protein